MNRLAAPLSRLLDGAAAADFGDWLPLLSAWRGSVAGQALIAAVDARVAAGAAVFPSEVFRAFTLTPLASTRVLIVGQDPYHGAGQAEGLAFSVPEGIRVPPSLRNIQRELERDLQIVVSPTHGSLARWARQGVMLLNASLTVEEGRPGSHAGLGWRNLTDAVCAALAADAAPKAVLLWGAHAQRQFPPTSSGSNPHLVLRSNHPSPLSAQRPPTPFIGCGHFGRTNRFLAASGRGQIDWRIS